MKRLQCEMCGSTELIKQDGVFVCQLCGVKYSVEEARKMLIEGVVDVSGSTVKIDNSAVVENYIPIAQNALNAGNYTEAEVYCNKLIEEDFSNVLAWKIKSMAVIHFEDRMGESGKYLNKAIGLNNGNKDEIIAEVVSYVDNYVKETYQERLTSVSYGYEKEKYDSVISLLKNANMFYQEISLNTNNNRDLLRSLVENLESKAIRAWDDAYAPMQQATPDREKLQRFMDKYEMPIRLLSGIVSATPYDTNNNINRLKKLKEWAEKIINAKSYRWETIDEMFDRLHVPPDGRYGNMRKINLMIHTQELTVDLVPNEETRSKWREKIKEWEEQIKREEAEKKRLENIKREQERKKQQERQQKINEYWNNHIEEKEALENETKWLTSEIERINCLLSSKNKEKLAINDEISSNRVPSEIKKRELEDEVRKLENERASLGIFQGTRKKEITAQIERIRTQIPNQKYIDFEREEFKMEKRPQMDAILKEINEYVKNIQILNKKKEECRSKLNGDNLIL